MKRDIVEKLEFGCPFKRGTVGEKDAELAEVIMQEAAEELKRLREDREWQIKQNVKMFESLEQIGKHLELPCDKRDDGVLEQIVAKAMVEAV